MGLGEFGRGEGLGLQAVAGLGEGEMGQFGHGTGSSSSRTGRAGDPGIVCRRSWVALRVLRRRSAEDDGLYSTTFGTRKKLSSVAGALRTILSG